MVRNAKSGVSVVNVNEARELQATLDRLYLRRAFGIKLGLHVEEALLEHLGNPQRELVCIHVAGTNGKGSVCALLDSILRAAGFRTGRYTSPHLVRFNERICVNDVPIADADLGALASAAERAAVAVEAALGQAATFFEITTAMAFQYFRDQAVDIVLLEVGMGGRLDATNVVTPLVSVITTIGMDHAEYLGPDLASIAREKCGIIKPGRPVVSGVRGAEAAAVIRAEAAKRQSPLTEAWEAVSVRARGGRLDGQKVVVESVGGISGTLLLPLLGGHQLDNLAVALATVDLLQEALSFEGLMKAVKCGVADVRWPGRLQVLDRSPLTLLDGAHNLAAAERLGESLQALASGAPVGLVCGFCGDKDVRGFLRALSGTVKRAWFVPIANARGLAVGDLRQAAAGLSWDILEADVEKALADSKAWARSAGGVVCITGSLYLVGEVLGLDGGNSDVGLRR